MMLLTIDRVVTVDEVPVGTFFYLKPQGGAAQLAFMANQIARREGDFTGPVVVTFPVDGRSSPRRADSFPLAVAAVLPDVNVLVDADDLGDTSTETLGVPAGLLLHAAEHRLITLAWGELDAVTYVNLDTGEYRLSEAAGNWLSFKKWQLQASDSTILHTGATVDRTQR